MMPFDRHEVVNALTLSCGTYLARLDARTNAVGSSALLASPLT